jgi:hypothetical protein
MLLISYLPSCSLTMKHLIALACTYRGLADTARAEHVEKEPSFHQDGQLHYQVQPKSLCPEFCASKHLMVFPWTNLSHGRYLDALENTDNDGLVNPTLAGIAQRPVLTGTACPYLTWILDMREQGLQLLPLAESGTLMLAGESDTRQVQQLLVPLPNKQTAMSSEHTDSITERLQFHLIINGSGCKCMVVWSPCVYS